LTSFFFLFRFIYILNSILVHITIQVAYSLGSSKLISSGRTQAFANLMCFDGLLCIVAPSMLLYSSKELRKSIRTKWIQVKRSWKA